MEQFIIIFLCLYFSISLFLTYMFFKYLAFESLIKDKKDDYYYYLLPIQILFNAFVFFGGIPFVIFNIRKTIKLYTQMKFDMWLWKESGITFYIKKPSEYN